jgi:phenylacetate-CoA ligase
VEKEEAIDLRSESRTAKPEDIPKPGFREWLGFMLIRPLEFLLKLARLRDGCLAGVFRVLPFRYVAWTSRVLERRAFFRALSQVPAYASYVQRSQVRAGEIPETNRDSYIRAFPVQERCVGGRIPERYVMVDESSGSTGTPYNWVRSLRERQECHLAISRFMSYCFGTGPKIIVNTFSMGAWATGLNMGIALQGNGVVKNTGPDIPKALGTLKFFGSGMSYLVTGYPPFLKHLVDVAMRENLPLKDYRLYALVGGEGMSEGLRDYLLGHFKAVYSGYGATDLEIGLAGETPLSLAIRRLARGDPRVFRALFGRDSRLPMLFQYDPLAYHVEVNGNRELLVTITRPSLLSPRIRYNVHDQGGVAYFEEMEDNLMSLGVRMRGLQGVRQGSVLRLPFLWVYGRSDYTISVMGANVYPEDLESALYADPALARITRSFCLSVSEYRDCEVRPCFIFEIEADPGPELEALFRESVLERLRLINTGFREALRECGEGLSPEIRLYRPGEGPFAGDGEKIKQRRFLARLDAAEPGRRPGPFHHSSGSPAGPGDRD